MKISRVTLISVLFLLITTNAFSQTAVSGNVYTSGSATVTAVSSTDLSQQNQTSATSALFTGIAIDVDNVWAVDNVNDLLYKIQKSPFAVLGSFATGNDPFGVSVDENFVWVTNQDDDTVGKYNKTTGALITTISLPANSEPYGISSDGTFVWVANNTANSVTKINATTNAIEQTFTLTPRTPGSGQSHGGANELGPVDVKSDGTTVWVATSKDTIFTPGSSGGTFDGAITKIDIATGDTSVVEIPSAPFTIYVDDYFVWVAQVVDGSVAQIDKVSGVTINEFSTPALNSDSSLNHTPWGISSDGSQVWVALRNGVSGFTDSDGGMLRITPSGQVTRIESSVAGIFQVSQGDMTGLAYDLLFGTAPTNLFAQTSPLVFRTTSPVASGRAKRGSPASLANDSDVDTYFQPRSNESGILRIRLPRKTALDKVYFRFKNLTNRRTRVNWTLQYKRGRRWRRVARRTTTFSGDIWVHAKSNINRSSRQFRLVLNNRRVSGKRRAFGISEIEGY